MEFLYLFVCLFIFYRFSKVEIRLASPSLWVRLRELDLSRLEEKRLQGGPYSSLSVSEGGLQESWEGLFIRICSNRMRGDSFKLE